MWDGGSPVEVSGQEQFSIQPFLYLVFFVVSRWLDIDIRELWETITYRGFQKLALQYIGFGMMEVMRSAFPRMQVSLFL